MVVHIRYKVMLCLVINFNYYSARICPGKIKKKYAPEIGRQLNTTIVGLYQIKILYKFTCFQSLLKMLLNSKDTQNSLSAVIFTNCLQSD